MKVVVLTTSYPRWEGDAAGRFVADAVRHVEERDIRVDVVHPGRFRHFGIAYGAGVAPNLRARPWKGLLVPPLLASFARAARTAARDADVVHAHWLPAGGVALATGKPVVVQLWGTDVELARRLRPLAYAVLRGAAVVVCASTALAREARALGARDVRVIPSGVDIPAVVPEPEHPPWVLFAGRLSPEKGILELQAAMRGLPYRLVVAGDGPLRRRVPGALGFVPHAQLQHLYARAAVVAVPSRREGYGVVCAEAMAHGRPVVATSVGGLVDLVEHDVTGVLVDPGDLVGLRRELRRLLGDVELRRQLGEAARARARARLAWDVAADHLVRAYEDALDAA